MWGMEYFMPNPSVAWYTKSLTPIMLSIDKCMHALDAERCCLIRFSHTSLRLATFETGQRCRLRQVPGHFKWRWRRVDDFWKCLWRALDHMVIPCEMTRYKYQVAWTLLAISLTSWTCPNSVPSFFLWVHLVASHSYMICIYIYRIQQMFWWNPDFGWSYSVPPYLPFYQMFL